MIMYTNVGISDLARSQVFYDAIMATIGNRRLSQSKDELGYGPSGSALGPEFCWLWVGKPYDDSKPASHGNGQMTAFSAQNRAAVDAFHATALASGGSDEGAPGLRYRENFYACYVRDPDGNKLSAVCDQAE